MCTLKYIQLVLGICFLLESANLGLVAQAWNPSTWEAWSMKGEMSLSYLSKTLSQKPPNWSPLTVELAD